MSYKLYPITKTKESCQDYEVKINGNLVALDTARVSSVPFNRRWPGHQRSKEQTELINFLSFATDEAVTFEITPPTPFESVVIRPLSLGIRPEIRDGTIIFTLERPAYFTVEPYGRSGALHIFADPMPRYAPPADDPNVIYFGKGEHDAGEIVLESNQTLFIDEGAVLYACVRATDAENVRILGRGILDNSKNTERILFECNAEGNGAAIKNAVRKHTIQLEYCTDVEIDGITIRDSLVYNIRPVACKNLRVSNVKIIGCWRYNSDGIDMHNCENVLIENCFLRTFDDSVCIKGFDCYHQGDVEEAVKKAMYRNGKSYDVFKNAVVRNCTVWNDWGRCLEIGAETRAEEICNITFENCDIIHVNNAVLDCLNVDYAEVHDVLYRNINVEYDDTVPKGLIQTKDSETYRNTDPDYAPNLISARVLCHPEYSAGGSRRGTNRNIRFSNIHLYGRQKPKLYFEGCDEFHKTRDIVIENLFWNGELLKELDKDQFVIRDHAENICYKVNDYEQLEQNTVAAARQLKDSNVVKFFRPDGKGKRVMFLGNSMALHGKRPEIGWNGAWGMAASSREKDYVHRLMSAVSETDGDSAFCLCQVAEWEMKYKDGKGVYHKYENARSFDADIIVMRCVENCPKNDFDPKSFEKAILDLLRYFNPSERAKIILTTGFWRHPGDEVIAHLAKKFGFPLVELGDLGERDDMKAIGLFEHSGVANHPGDRGMEEIARRIFGVLKNEL